MDGSTRVGIVRDTVVMSLTLGTIPIPHSASASMTVRAVARDDITDLARVFHRAYQGTVDDEGETQLDAINELQKTMDGAYGEFDWPSSLVAEVDGFVVAACLVTSWKDRPLLAFAVTIPEYQRRGIGGHLIHSSAVLLGERGESELRLVVTSTNPSVSLYQQLGFRRVLEK